MMIDAHHHLWKFNQKDYGWMDSSMKVLQRDYLPGELLQEIRMAGVEATVVVQARQLFEETGWLLGLSEIHPFIKGVVGWVDLCAEDVKTQLGAVSHHSKLVGFRHVIHDEAEDDFMLRPQFLRGIEALGEYELTYDLLIFPRHLRNAKKLVAMFPGQRFVLDHMAKPFIKDGIMQPWMDDIASLAEQENVWCKISGLVSEGDHMEWKYEDFVPYMEALVNAFGSGRLMLGSDWPVCKLAAEYEQVLQIPFRFIKDWSELEKEQIKYINAIECYQLEN